MQNVKPPAPNEKHGTTSGSAGGSEVTTHPTFAVFGVLLGALTSVFAGRLLSVGSADIQGALGVSSDYMTWVSTAYNASNMFIGPLTVYIGGLLGARRVLLWACSIFIAAEFLTPFLAHDQTAFVAAQALAGLSAGTFYPLTFTMIVRNFSLKYLYFGVAIYSLDILGSTHLAHLIAGFYVAEWGWQWLFWNALLMAPLMMLCVYFGIPVQAPNRKPDLDFSGFLYASCSLTLLYIVLDQGERLDWFHSPLIAAFTGAGLFLLSVTVVLRRLRPNPMINLSFIASRNFLLLGAVLVSFRFVILSSTLLVPGFLSALHGYRPEQTALVLAWISIPELFLAPLAGLCLYKIDSRLTCAIGFTLVGLGSAVCSQFTPAWTGETFYATQLIIAAGLAFALTGIVASILRSAMAANALTNPINILTISCWFQTCRLFGGEFGKTVMSHFLKVRGDFHYSVLASHINGDWLTTERLTELSSQFYVAPNEAIVDGLIGAKVALQQQIALLTFGDGFILIASVCVLTIVACGLIGYTPPLLAKGK